MKKILANLKLATVVRSSLIIITLTTISSTSYSNSSIEFSHEPPFYLKSIHIDPNDLNQNAIPGAGSGEWWNHIVINGKDIAAQYQCNSVTLEPNIMGSDGLPNNKTDPKRLEYMEHAANDLLKCPGWHILWGPSDPTNKHPKTATIHYHDRHTDHWGRYTYITATFPINMEQSPASCNAVIVNPVNFGVLALKKSKNPIAHGTIELVCDNDATASFKINNGLNLINPDRSVISFDNISSVYLPANVPIHVDVAAQMISPPDSPGKYKWYAPVVVKFD